MLQKAQPVFLSVKARTDFFGTGSLCPFLPSDFYGYFSLFAYQNHSGSMNTAHLCLSEILIKHLADIGDRLFFRQVSVKGLFSYLFLCLKYQLPL